MHDFEPASAHDCDDCLPDCLHPDHYYDGDDFTEDHFAELYRRVTSDGPYVTWEDALRQLGINVIELDGPVEL